MKILPISSIIIPPDRQRREFEPLAVVELTDSIVANGLLSPIVVREMAGVTFLVAGERRLRAVNLAHEMGDVFQCDGHFIPPNHIPTLSLGELTPLAAEEAEYEENVRRESLTWQERAEAESRLHKLRVRQDPSQTITDTAEEIHGRPGGRGQDSLRKGLIVTQYFDDSDVRHARTLDDAMKVLERKEATRKNVELAETVGLTFSSRSHSVHHGDAITWMEGCPSNSFDVILTDPPYGMDAQEFGDGGGKLDGFGHSYNDSEEYFTLLMSSFFQEAFRITKPQAHIYVCCDIDRYHWLRFQGENAGFWMHRSPLINYKPNGARVPWPHHGPQRQWEMILYGVKGKRPVNLIAPDVITTRLTEEKYNFGAQKPIALYTDLLKRSVRPGDRVLDPFAGTGTILPAAHELKCLATAVEMDTDRYGICLKRLGELV